MLKKNAVTITLLASLLASVTLASTILLVNTPNLGAIVRTIISFLKGVIP